MLKEKNIYASLESPKGQAKKREADDGDERDEDELHRAEAIRARFRVIRVSIVKLVLRFQVCVVEHGLREKKMNT